MLLLSLSENPEEQRQIDGLTIILMKWLVVKNPNAQIILDWFHMDEKYIPN